MEILQLCKKFPFPLKDGESIAVTYLSRALYDLGCQLTLLSMNTTKHYVDIKSLPNEFNHYKDIYVTELDNSVNILGAVKNLFSKDSYHVSRFICHKFERQLIELLQKNKYDVIQLETLYLAPYIDTIKKYSDAIVTMRAHNVEFEIWERISKNTKFLPKKWYLTYLAKKLKRFELENLNKYDYLIAVSERDLKQFKNLGYKNGALASPIGLDIKNYITIPPRNNPKSICFIGALDWLPNAEGLLWFLNDIWPTLHNAYPEVQLNIAGRNTPKHILNLDIPQVNVHGEVDDALEFMNASDVMIVPLFAGSGMRVKILEGMALGKLILTTSLGLEGIHATNGIEVLIADTKEEYLNQLIAIFSNKIDTVTIGQNAKTFVSKQYDHEANAIKLLEKYTHLKSSPAYKKS